MLTITTEDKPTRSKIVVYGPESVGKSTFASNFPRPVFIDLEGSTSKMKGVARTPRPHSWASFIQIIENLVKDTQGYETLVIDTADKLEQLAIKSVCSTLKISGFGGNKDYGQSYNTLTGMFSDLLTLLDTDLIESGKMNIAFVVHSALKKFELPEEAGQYDRYELNLEKKISPLFKQWADFVFFLNFKTILSEDKDKIKRAQGGQKRIICTSHTAAYDAKSRIALPAEIDLLLNNIDQITPCFAYSEPDSKEKSLPAASSSNPIGRLQEVMNQDSISYQELVQVLNQRGYVTANIPMENLSDDMIEGLILANWPQVKNRIEANRTIEHQEV